MELVATRPISRQAPGWEGVDTSSLAVWALGGGLVLYLALNGGGYDLVVRSHLAIAVWWLTVLGVVSGLLPAARLTRPAWLALGLFAAFAIWTALATTWSSSSERSLDEVARVASYLGVLVLAVLAHRDWRSAVRHTVEAVALAIVAVAVIALLSRLRPSMFPGGQVTASLLPEAHGRLAWPLNYWNALAALIALGLPLVFSLATSARTIGAQAVSAAALPALVVCGYFTLSRAGLIAAVVAVGVFLALAPERIEKLPTLAVAAAGSAFLVVGAAHRHALEQGLTDHAARHQGATLLVAIIVVCVGVGLAQIGLGLAARHGTTPHWLKPTPQGVRALLTTGLAAVIVIAVLAGAPAKLRHAWHEFKQPTAAGLTQSGIGRFGVTSGNGRYSYWKVAVKSTRGDLLQGQGPGTFQLIWQPRAPFYSYVRNAHSLYVETLAEVGLVGLMLLVGFLAVLVVTAVRRARRGPPDLRMPFAACAAALVAFSVSAAFDWVWQVPALPVAMLLIAGAVLAPSRAAARRTPRRVSVFALRAGTVVAAAASLLAIGVTLAATQALRSSQAEAATGNLSAALADARQAARLEPAGESPRLQIALVYELAGDWDGAMAATRQAIGDEPLNWQPWLVLSRLEAKAGRPLLAVADFRRARSLNPRSPVFRP